MTHDDLSNVKPGDTLFYSSRWNKGLLTVERVTPTGRVITKGGSQFDPSGYRRGDKGFDRVFARVATPDDIAGVNRANLVSKIERFRAWAKLTPEHLKSVADIIGAYD